MAKQKIVIESRPVPPKKRPKRLRWPLLRLEVGKGFEVKTFREVDAVRASVKGTIRRRIAGYDVGYRTVRNGFYVFRKPNRVATPA